VIPRQQARADDAYVDVHRRFAVDVADQLREEIVGEIVFVDRRRIGIDHPHDRPLGCRFTAEERDRVAHRRQETPGRRSERGEVHEFFGAGDQIVDRLDHSFGVADE
jgi:hypothetical protein